MPNYQHHVDRVVVFFSGELTFDPAVDLVDTIEMLIGVYFYALVDLLIASPGGVAAALDHYLDATRRWRDAGVRLRTRATACADSAAALMLSLGDERLAEPCARFLYHAFRVVQPGSLTAYQSARFYADLARLDEAYLARLVDRAMDGADGAPVVSADVEPSDLQVLDRLTAGLHPPAKAAPRSPRALARVLERCVRGAIRSKDRAALAEIDGAVGTRDACRGSALRQCALLARLLTLRATEGVDVGRPAFELFLRAHAGRFEPSFREDSDGAA